MTVLTRRVTPQVCVHLLLIGCLVGFSLEVHAQTPSAAANLATGISQVRAGEYFTALFTLNQVVKQTSAPNGDVATLSRAHAFRAMAYAGLNQPERARAAVTLALKADPNIAVGVPEFSPATVGLFAEERRHSANPETVCQEAEQAHRFQQAFLFIHQCLSIAFGSPPAANDRRLREKLMKVVQRLETPPAIPPESRARVTRGPDQAYSTECKATASASPAKRASGR